MLKTVQEGFNGFHKLFRATRVIATVARREETTAVQVESESEETEKAKEWSLTDLRFKYPEFLPDPNVRYRNILREELERNDMMRRRHNIDIPEFYVGSVLAVTTSDVHSPGKTVRFVGICISRSECGLNAKFVLRNVINNQGVEVIYSLYGPTIQKIEVIRLEKRLDNELFYLRDAPLEYSTFPFNMEKQYINLKAEVPINPIQVPLNPRPWLLRYETMDLKGVILPPLSEKIMKKAEKIKKPWEKYDLMKTYRESIPQEEQESIFSDICNTLEELELKQKEEKQKKDFVKPKRQTLF